MLQSDGNLVLKDGEAIIWIADANQPYSATLHPKKMREPLQFVISNSGFLYDPSRRRLWIAESTHSTDKSLWYNTYMTVQDDGNLVIYDQARAVCAGRVSVSFPGACANPSKSG